MFNYLLEIFLLTYSIHLVLKFRMTYEKTKDLKYKWLSYGFIIISIFIILGRILQLINL